MRTSILLVAVAFALTGTTAASAPNNADLQMRCLRDRTPDAAIAACNTLLQMPDLDERIRSVALNGRANNYYAKRDFEHAIQDFSEAIMLMPNAMLYDNRANVYRSMGKYDLAIEDGNKAIEIDPNSSYAFEGRANSYVRAGRFDLAETDYEQALKLGPERASLYANRGGSYFLSKNFDLAIQ